jgi:hypothetical protein
MKLEWNFFMEPSACGFSDRKEYTVRRYNYMIIIIGYYAFGITV